MTRLSLLFVASIAFLASATLSTSAQDIGLTRSDGSYLSLNFVQNFGQDSKGYRGFVSDFDSSAGFKHLETDARILSDKHLLLTEKVNRDGIIQDNVSLYVKGGSDVDVAWRQELPCLENCVERLVGATQRSDDIAEAYLDYYEVNTDKRSVSLNRFVAQRDAESILCNSGLENFCKTNTPIGLVMEQSQVGAATIVAEALSATVEVANFSIPNFDGAMVVSSPELIEAVFRATGPTLSDGVLDFGGWRVVDASGTINDNLNYISVEIREEGQAERIGFFDHVLEQPTDKTNINQKMTEFFRRLTNVEDGCYYDVTGNRPEFICYIHSSELGGQGSGAWIRSKTMLSVYRRKETLVAEAHTYLGLKYGGASTPPEGRYDDVNYDNGDEAFFASLSEARLIRSFENHFEPFAIVTGR